MRVDYSASDIEEFAPEDVAQLQQYFQNALIEALANQIDAVVNRSQGSRIFNNKPWSTWADVEGAADKWAEGIRAGVDEAHGR